MPELYLGCRNTYICHPEFVREMNKLKLSPKCRANFSVKVEKLDREMRNIEIRAGGLFDEVTNRHGEDLIRIKAPLGGINLRAIFSFEQYKGKEIALLVCGFIEKDTENDYKMQALRAANRLKKFRRNH